VIENATGGSGNDDLIGNAADNTITGNAGNDIIGDSLGDDIMYGGDGHDSLLNGSGISALYGGDGNDLLLGGNQVDSLFGGDGSDALRGDHAGDIIGGSDKLYGGAGDDMLMGGLGADEFIFAPNEGSDTIATFDAASHSPTSTPVVVSNGVDFIQGLDVIVLSGFSGATTADVLANVTESGGNSIFTAEGTTITVFGVTGLTIDDFEII
ncbi:MAG: calcium-binding protein, partial [Planktomarina sp.]